VASTTNTLVPSTQPQTQPVKTTPSQLVKPQLTATGVIPKQPKKTDALTQPRTYKEKLATETFAEGSRLTLMALKYYGNKLFWVYIYEANKDKIANPDYILAGTRIMIPKLNPKLIDIHNPQCLIQASALQTAYTKQKNIKHTK
jgi:nucleoid-associated protein YgaU